MNNIFTLKLETANDKIHNYRFPSRVEANDLALIVIDPQTVYAKVCSGNEGATTTMVYGHISYERAEFVPIGPPAGWTVIGPREDPVHKCPTCGKAL